jgi:succinate dehydrogenase/fumarate reductase flavoprotein subunit
MTREVHETDVLVVGTGAAGTAAAIAALEGGATVTLLEAAEAAGGTTRSSGGAFWIPNNHWMRAAGAVDPRDEALRLMARLAYPALYDPQAPQLGVGAREHALLATYYDEGAAVVERLAQLGAIDAMILPGLGASPSPISDPDYHAEFPENVAPYGRVLTAIPEPGAMVWPGVFLADGLLAHLRARGAQVLTGHRVEQAWLDGEGRTLGVVATHAGERRSIRARRGVVFATGGFAHGAGRAQALLRGPIFGSGSVSSADGVMLDIAAQVGAQLGNLGNAFYYQVAIEDAIAGGGAVRHPYAHGFLPYGDSMILVDVRGRRIVNEKAMYHVRTQSHFDSGGVRWPNLVQLMIYDQAVADEPTFWPWRGVVPLPGTSSPFVISGDTLEQLAARVAERLERLAGARGLSAAIGPDVRLAPDFVATLRATIDRFNGFAASGVDLDFQRGETPIQQAWQGPSRSTTANRTMTPIAASGPYHCVLLGAGVLDTCGGPVIDSQARVLRVDGRPAPGLFAAGNCVASPVGQAYWGAGGTIGPALVFGWIAGRNAAALAGA